MSAFKKGWAERFKTNPSSEEVMVRTAYQQSTIAKADRKGTRKASTPMLPPILNVKHIGDLPQERDHNRAIRSPALCTDGNSVGGVSSSNPVARCTHSGASAGWNNRRK